MLRTPAPHPPSPALNAWLQAPGSLTARLRAHGSVQVRVLRQGSAALWPSECADLHTRSGHVREVALLLDGVPVVWARSCTPHAALQGPWKSLRRLGTRPLAELLFLERQVLRDPLSSHALPRHGLEERHLRAHWNALRPQPTPRWARSSVFWLHGQPLRVMEAFAPWVARLSAYDTM